jgi:hypothetical protein
MAKKPTLQEGEKQQTAGVSKDEQLTDILLIMDRQELKLTALSTIDKKGKAKTVPANAKEENSFLKFDKYSGIVENFILNFRSQFKEPARWQLLRLSWAEYAQNRTAIRELAEGKQSSSVDEFLRKYEIRPKETGQINNSNNNQTESNMATQNQTMQASATGNLPEGGTKYRFNESLIDWKQLENFGLSKEFLHEKGLLDSMLKGYKTNQTVPISMNFGSAVLRTDARLSFQQSPVGSVILAIHGIRKEPELDRAFFGHIFTPEDKKNLKETGNMGRVVELKTRSGEMAPSLVSLDKLTNEIVAMRAENVYIPQEIKGVKLTQEEIADLKDGKAVYLEGMISQNNKEFNAHVQVNADRRGIEFIFENDRLFNSRNIGGVELSPKQVETLNEGKAIFVEDMKRKDGERFSSFVKLDEATGRPAYTRYNPDSPEGAREIYIPKEICGVNLTAEDRKELGEGKPVFLENMVNRKGEEFSSFVKLDTETGRLSYSRTPNGFSERQEVKIPAEIMGVLLTARQRADLQDGKSTLIQGIKGFDGKSIDQYAKANERTGRIDLYNEDPNRVREASRRNVVEEKKEEKAKKEDVKKESAPKKKASLKVG